MSDLVGNPEDRFSRVAAQILPSLHAERIFVINLESTHKYRQYSADPDHRMAMIHEPVSEKSNNLGF